MTPGKLLRILNLRSSDGVDTRYPQGCDEEQLKDQHSGVLVMLVVNSTMVNFFLSFFLFNLGSRADFSDAYFRRPRSLQVEGHGKAVWVVFGRFAHICDKAGSVV